MIENVIMECDICGEKNPHDKMIFTDSENLEAGVCNARDQFLDGYCPRCWEVGEDARKIIKGLREQIDVLFAQWYRTCMKSKENK